MMATQLWSDIRERKKREILDTLKSVASRRKAHELVLAVTLEEASQLQNFQAFEAALERICIRYANTGLPQLMKNKLYPHFDHIRSFSNALSTAAQANSIAAICWGGLLVVIQCGCVFTELLQGIMDQLMDLNARIPDLVKNMELYPSSPALRFALQDIFEDYIDYCIVILKWLGRNPCVTFLRSLVSSTMRRDLQKMKSKIANHVEIFNRKAEIAHRTRAEQLGTQTLAAISNSQQTATISPSPEYPLDTVALPRNKDFIGRAQQLKDLKKFLIDEVPGAEPISCILHGVGGFGKTQTALEFVYRQKRLYDAIFWIRAENKFELLSSFGAVGRQLCLFNTEDIKQPEIEKIQNWLKTTERRWLLIFDNVVDWTSISTYWPANSNRLSSIIVTAQESGDWCKHQILMEPLDNELGSQLLLRQVGLPDIEADHPDRYRAQEVSKLLGGSPLLLNQAGGLMNLSKCTMTELVQIQRESNTLLRDSNTGENWRYERAVSATFDPMLKRLSSGALDLLMMLAFMNPDHIEEDILLGAHRTEDLAFLSSTHKAKYFVIVSELAKGELVKRRSDSMNAESSALTSDETETSQERYGVLTTHRSLQDGLLQKMNKNLKQRQLAFDRVVNLLREKYPPPTKRQQAEAQAWPVTKKLLPHLLSLASAFDRSDPQITGNLQFAELLSDIGGINMYDRGFNDDAQRLLEVAERVLDSLGHPEESTLRGNILTVLGLISDTLGISKRAEGEQIRKRNITIRSKCLEQIPKDQVTVDDEILRFNADMDWVCSLQQYNRFDEVMDAIKECLKQYQKWGTEEEYPYEYAKYWNHIPYVLMYNGKMEEALEAAKRGSDLMETAQPGSQMAVTFKFDWATVLFQSGQTDLAIKEHKALLQARTDGCGELSWMTLQSQLHIGIMYYYVNKLAEAEKWIRQALLLDQGVLPKEDIARANYYLAQILKHNDPSSDESVQLERQGKESLMRLLKLDGSGTMKRYLEEENWPILFDYIVTWECRLITPRKLHETGVSS